MSEELPEQAIEIDEEDVIPVDPTGTVAGTGAEQQGSGDVLQEEADDGEEDDLTWVWQNGTDECEKKFFFSTATAGSSNAICKVL